MPTWQWDSEREESATEDSDFHDDSDYDFVEAKHAMPDQSERKKAPAKTERHARINEVTKTKRHSQARSIVGTGDNIWSDDDGDNGASARCAKKKKHSSSKRGALEDITGTGHQSCGRSKSAMASSKKATKLAPNRRAKVDIGISPTLGIKSKKEDPSKTGSSVRHLSSNSESDFDVASISESREKASNTAASLKKKGYGGLSRSSKAARARIRSQQGDQSPINTNASPCKKRKHARVADDDSILCDTDSDGQF